MKKRVLVIVTGIIIVGIAYFGFEIFDFAKGVKEDAKKDKYTPELKTQIQLFDYPTSDKVEFNIKSEKEYYHDKPIKIKLIWENKSNITEKIIIKNHLEHPLGTGVSIVDSNNMELTKLFSSHVLSSQLFTREDLKEYEIDLKPNESKEYLVDLLKIPILKQTDFNQKNALSKGKYKIQVSYYSRISDKIEIEIK